MTKLADHLHQSKTTQEAFASVLNCRQATVSRIANGITSPTLEQAWLIEKATNGDVDLYSWLDQNDVEQFRNEQASTAEETVDSQQVDAA